jgi:predicted NAD/FAD-binding protein
VGLPVIFSKPADKLAKSSRDVARAQSTTFCGNWTHSSTHRNVRYGLCEQRKWSKSVNTTSERAQAGHEPVVASKTSTGLSDNTVRITFLVDSYVCLGSVVPDSRFGP